MITSPELFINMKSYPTNPDSDEYFDFWEAEKEKCRNGVTINGVYISGWLYWHINHWRIWIDGELDEWGEIPRISSTPQLRDNEWLLAEAEFQAKMERKGLIICGSRQFGKSEFIASYTARTALLFEGSQNVVVGSNSDDLATITSKIDYGLLNCSPYFRMPRITRNWDDGEVLLGYKDGKNDNHLWSTFWVRNTQDGRRTEVTAGTTMKSLIYDEIGKAPFKKSFIASKPALLSKHGWRCIPILVGCLTAGNKVFTKEGNLVNIEDLHKQDGIIGFDTSKQIVSLEDITHINPPQKKECYKLITNKGSVIECSYDHPILVKHRNKVETISPNKQRRVLEFVETENIKVGDVVSLPSIIPLQGNRVMEHPYFIGAIIGDGNYSSDRGIRFYNEDQEIWDYIDSINKDYTVFNSHITKKGRVYKEARFRGGMKQLKELGIYGQSGVNKDLPLDIHLYCEDTVCELLAGLFDTDGCVVADNIKNNYIFLSSGSEKLIDSVKLLLLRLGIHSNKSFKKADQRDRKIKSSKGYYELYIADRESVLTFIEKIPLKIIRKKEKLDCLKKFFENKKSQIDSNYPGIRFEKVVSIEKVGLKPVYNLTTSTTHTYLANGIITHNTGGAFDKGNDAESIFNDPGSQNLLEFPHSTKPGVKVGLFVPGTYRQDAKKETTLSEFLGLEKGTELDIPMQVRDIPKAMQIIEDNLKAAKRDPDPTVYLKEKAYYPLEEEDMFIPITETVFPIDLLQGQLEFINQNHIQSECVELYKDREGKIRHKPTTKVPVTTFPIKPSDNNEGVVQIWEYPVIDAPPGLYTAGMDPYKFSQAVYSDSLGALYIYKRVHDLSGEGWRNMVVACYVGRPKEINKWHETARLLLDFYNCKVLCENQDMSFINHCLAKNDAFKYLERTPSFLDEIHPNSTVNRVYGIHMTNDIKGYLIGRIIEYLTEVIGVEYDDQGNKVKERLGVTRILDPMLIKELMKYAKKGNFDRVISFGLTLAMAKNMDPVYNVTDKVDNRYEAYNNIAKRKKTLFTQTRNPFRSY